MHERSFKFYRLGPIAAFDSSAHSVHQLLMSYYFSLLGFDSFIYLRNLKPEAGSEKLEEFLGISFPKNLKVKLSLKHKGISSLINFLRLFSDLNKNRAFSNWVFLSKESHVLFLSKFKKIFNFKIVFENHKDKLCSKGTDLADLVYVVSPFVYERLKEKGLSKVILWTYHYPVREDLFNIKESFKKKDFYTLGYVGSLHAEKGIHKILKLLSELPAKLKLIGGNEKERKEIEKVILKLNLRNRVILRGFVPQNRLRKELEEVDILIAPFTPKQRTIPLKVYEYLATGIPVIASNVESVKVVAGNLFFYFSWEKPESFKQAFWEVVMDIENTNRKLRMMRDYSRNFHWEKVVRRIVKDLESVEERC